MKDLDQSDVQRDADAMGDLEDLREHVKRQYPNVEVNRETTSDGWDYYLYIPYNEFKWPEPGDLFDVRCIDHLNGRWATKGPSRLLHWCGWGEKGFEWSQVYGYSECTCKTDKLYVRVPLGSEWLKLEDDSGPAGD